MNLHTIPEAASPASDLASDLASEPACAATAGLHAVERTMRDAALEGLAPTGPLASAAAWHLAVPGHRVRAQLALACGHGLGLSPQATTAVAASAELLHEASLVHDDLQDGDRTRRGRPALWVAFDRDTALCVGDLFVSAAYAALVAVPETACTAPSLHRRIAETVGGQTRDRRIAHGREACTTLEAWESVAAAKSGPLLGLPLELCLNAVGDPTSAETAVAAGYRVALAYQYADDLADTAGDRAAATPNAVLVCAEADGIPERLARRRILRRAQRHLDAGRTLAGALPSVVRAALVPLERRLADSLAAADAAVEA
jgi:geranylgeranyl diphosphate synthase type II